MNYTLKLFDNISLQSVSVIAQSALQVLSISILARFLLPIDFGIAAVATSITAISTMLSEIGVGSSVVQKKTIDYKYVSTAFFTSLILFLVFSFFLYLLAPTVASFNSDQSLINVIYFIIFSFFITGISSIPKALLFRKQEYKKIMIVNLISFFVGNLIVAGVLAVNGFGVWAILWGQLVLSILSFFLSYYFSSMKIKFVFSFSDLKHIAHFGGGITLSRIFNYIAIEGDKFVIGNTISLTALGIFERIYKITTLISSQIGYVFDSVLFPTFSQIQDDKNKLKRGYLKALEITFVIGCLISLIAPLFSYEIIWIVLGDTWLDYSEIFRMLLLLMGIRLIIRIGDSFLRSIAAVYESASIKILAAFITLFGLFKLSTFELNGVVFIYYLSSITVVIIIHSLIMHKLKIDFFNVLILLLKRFVVVTLLVFPIWIYVLFIQENMSIITLFVLKLIYLIILFILIFFIKPKILGNVSYEIILLTKTKLNYAKNRFSIK